MEEQKKEKPKKPKRKFIIFETNFHRSIFWFGMGSTIVYAFFERNLIPFGVFLALYFTYEFFYVRYWKKKVKIYEGEEKEAYKKMMEANRRFQDELRKSGENLKSLNIEEINEIIEGAEKKYKEGEND
ncbi:hypothetical protein ACFL56_00705 [Candidatus Margulisiibacteriota bacterium]